MQSTMNLLEQAMAQKSLAEWTKELGLSDKALYNAAYRKHLSPAVAGSIAEKLGEDVDHWIVIAAMESEKDSACKQRMLKRFQAMSRGVIKRCIFHTRQPHQQRRPLPAFSFRHHSRPASYRASNSRRLRMCSLAHSIIT